VAGLENDGYIQSNVRKGYPEQRTASLRPVDGLNVRDSRVHNYPPRWNAAPSQDLLVIRHNQKDGEVSLDPLRSGLIPYWCKDPPGGRKADHEHQLVRVAQRAFPHPS
jgi:putative SOS response-associated peptidase YedK